MTIFGSSLRFPFTACLAGLLESEAIWAVFFGNFGCLPFTRANRSVYRLGRFGQMVSKFPYWENSVRDWRLLFAEIPTIYQKICITATANEKVEKQKLWLTKQRLCTCVIFGIFLCRSVHNYNVKWPNSTSCVERKDTTVNFRFYNNNT